MFETRPHSLREAKVGTYATVGLLTLHPAYELYHADRTLQTLRELKVGVGGVSVISLTFSLNVPILPLNMIRTCQIYTLISNSSTTSRKLGLGLGLGRKSFIFYPSFAHSS